MTLESIQKLLGLVDRFEKVERLVYRTGEDRRENDVEHTYSLMMAAWFFIRELEKKGGKKLNLEKVLLYIMVHDLVEVYAGDTDSLSHSGLSDKKEREELALEKIKEETSYFPELYALIHEYEEQKDEEAVFIKSLDKLMPVFRNLRDNGRSFKEFHNDVDFESWLKFKEPKIKDKNVFKVWLEARDETETRAFLPKK